MNDSQLEIRVKGRSVFVPSAQIDGRTVITSGKWLRIAAAHDEELIEGEIVSDPQSFVSQLEMSGLDADIFTFAQKLGDTTPKYNYHLEWDNFAVIRITTFSEWWEKRVESSVRRAVRKAGKLGLDVRMADFDDEFVRGIVEINNETPIRQGRAFWHFQKSFEAVKLENSTYPGRNLFLGAYYGNELVGFLRLIVTDQEASIIQVLSKIKHYDKRPTNALISKAVEICEQRGLAHLKYCNYIYNDPNSSLTEFKRRNGFEQVLVPRYYIPLTFKGKIALRLGVHQGLKKLIPKPVFTQLLRLRSSWYARSSGAIEGTS
jgi:hypothetical protein